RLHRIAFFVPLLLTCAHFLSPPPGSQSLPSAKKFYASFRFLFYYVNPQERKPQAQRDWLEIL
ncbi:MAG: hypothetical protein ACI4OK_03240, partial [Selenomonas bovis]